MVGVFQRLSSRSALCGSASEGRFMKRKKSRARCHGGIVRPQQRIAQRKNVRQAMANTDELIGNLKGAGFATRELRLDLRSNLVEQRLSIEAGNLFPRPLQRRANTRIARQPGEQRGELLLEPPWIMSRRHDRAGRDPGECTLARVDLQFADPLRRRERSRVVAKMKREMHAETKQQLESRDVGRRCLT